MHRTLNATLQAAATLLEGEQRRDPFSRIYDHCGRRQFHPRQLRPNICVPTFASRDSYVPRHLRPATVPSQGNFCPNAAEKYK